MKIGSRRLIVMVLSVLGIISIEIVSLLTQQHGLSVSGAGAMVTLVGAYMGFDSVTKVGRAKFETESKKNA